jgi:site-specific DNA-cytosine methylase
VWVYVEIPKVLQANYNLVEEAHHQGRKDTRGIIYSDVKDKDNATAPKVDIYTAGFPCQAYSRMGSGLGSKESKGRPGNSLNVNNRCRRIATVTIH